MLSNHDIDELITKMNIPNFDGKLDYFTLSTSVIDMAEYGLRISDDSVKFLVKETLKRILGINITRSGSFARLKSLKIKLVKDVFVDTPNSKDNWITISTIEDIDNLNFDVHNFYDVFDKSKAKEMRDTIEKNYQYEEDLKKSKRKEKTSKKKVTPKKD